MPQLFGNLFSMNELEQIFKNSKGRWSTKWDHYFEIYHRHLSRFRNQEVHIVEFGVYQGGSLEIWKEYFGQECKIYGIDINPACKALERNGVKIFIGDQEDRIFLKSLKRQIPRIDILIDDGGHKMMQQIITFEEMYHAVEANGVYICEDIHTSFWPEFGGGFGKKNTFVNYSKKFVDYLNAYHFEAASSEAVSFCKNTHSIHFYDSILVIEKKEREKPKQVESGKIDKHFESYNPELDLLGKIRKKIRAFFIRLGLIN